MQLIQVIQVIQVVHIIHVTHVLQVVHILQVMQVIWVLHSMQVMQIIQEIQGITKNESICESTIELFVLIVLFTLIALAFVKLTICRNFQFQRRCSRNRTRCRRCLKGCISPQSYIAVWYLYSLVCDTVKDKLPDIQGGSIIKKTFQEALNAVSVPGTFGYQARRGVGERGENC